MALVATFGADRGREAALVPGVDAPVFGGSWSSYRFDSGTTVVSAIENGLFVLLPTWVGG